MSTIGEIIAQQQRTGRRIRWAILSKEQPEASMLDLHTEAILRGFDNIIFQPQGGGAEAGKASLCRSPGCNVVVFWPAKFCRFDGHGPATPNTPQPPPKPGVAQATWELVIADMHGRDQFGAAKYGLRHQHDNGRDHLIDAYQEALDLALYMRAEIAKREAGR